jgi:hypothetical protein
MSKRAIVERLEFVYKRRCAERGAKRGEEFRILPCHASSVISYPCSPISNPQTLLRCALFAIISSGGCDKCGACVDGRVLVKHGDRFCVIAWSGDDTRRWHLMRGLWERIDQSHVEIVIMQNMCERCVDGAVHCLLSVEVWRYKRIRTRFRSMVERFCSTDICVSVFKNEWT